MTDRPNRYEIDPRDVVIEDRGPYREWTFLDQFGVVWSDVQHFGELPPEERPARPRLQVVR